MSRRNSADVVVRLIAKDEGLKKALSEAGPAGEKALKQIQRASDKASPALKSVDAVASEVKQSVSQMTDRLGPAGKGLKALGPIGAGAAIGLGAVVAGFVAMNRAGLDAIATLTEIGDSAANLGLTTDQFQSLTFAAGQLQVKQGDLTRGLATFKKITDEAALGTGEFYSSIKRLNPELAEQIGKTDDVSDRLALFQKAFKEAGSETERNTLLVRGFGDGSVEVGRKLGEMEVSLDGLTEGAIRAGVVFEESLIRKAEEAAVVIEAANARMSVSSTRFKATFIDVAAETKDSISLLLDTLSALKTDDSFEGQIFKLETAKKRLLNQQESVGRDPVARFFLGEPGEFEKRIAEIEAELQRVLSKRREFEDVSQFNDLNIFEDAGPPQASADLQAAMNALRQEAVTATERQAEALAQLKAARTSGLITSDAEYEKLRAVIVEKYRDVDAIRAAAKADQDRKQAAAELSRQQAEAARIRAELGDITGVLSKRQDELNALVKAGTLEQGDAEASMRRFRESLDGTAEAKQLLTNAIAAGTDPIEKFIAQTKALEEAQALANIKEEDFNRLLALRAEKLAELQGKASDDRERDQFGETLDAAEKRIKDSLRTAEEVIDAKLAAERKVLEALVGEGSLGADEMAERLQKYEAELRDTTEATTELGLAQEVLDGILNGSIDSFEDLGRVGLRVLQDLLSQSAQTSGGIGNFFSSIFGGNNGGGSSGGAGGFLRGIFGGSAPSPTVPATVAHQGTSRVGSGGTRRQVPITAFLNAPRAHDGRSNIGRDEHAYILQDDERVFSASDNRALIAAINRPSNVLAMAPAPISVTVVDNAGVQTTAEERQDPNGNRELLLKIDKRIESGAISAIASPKGQSMMRQTYALRPKLGQA
ncbi:hypothetical protein [Litorimonas sp. WD9-15]|uniref:hypothetical protein n=1 Tax=Litorimonas sp. WD9-15 TaxID=3418716 RepID=UPI003CFCA281